MAAFVENRTIRLLTPPEAPTAFDNAVARFFGDLAFLRRAPATIKYYQFVLGNFAWWLTATGTPADPARLTAAHCKAFLLYVRDTPQRWDSRNVSSLRPAKEATVASYHRGLRAFFNWLVAEESLPRSPMAGVKLTAPLDPEILPFTEDQIARLLGQCNPGSIRGVRDTALIWVLLDTGMRASELCRLSLPDYDDATGRLRIQGAKRSGIREAPLSPPARAALRRWLHTYRPGVGTELDTLFVGLRPGAASRLTVTGLTAILRALGAKAGITDRRVSAHTFRHTFAVFYLLQGGDPISLQLRLGHRSSDMTRRYAHLQSEHLAALHLEYSPAGRIAAGAVDRYRRQAGTTPTSAPPPTPKPTACPVCAAHEEARPIKARGLCAGHLKRLERFGDVQANKPLKVYRARQR